MRAQRAQQPEPPLLRPRVRPLVREHDARAVRLDVQGRDEALADAPHAVGADELLLEPQVADRRPLPLVREPEPFGVR